MKNSQKTIIILPELDRSDWNTHLLSFLKKTQWQEEVILIARCGGVLLKEFQEHAGRVEVITDHRKLDNLCVRISKKYRRETRCVLVSGFKNSYLSTLFWIHDIPVFQLVGAAPNSQKDKDLLNKYCDQLNGMIFVSEEVRRATFLDAIHSEDIPSRIHHSHESYPLNESFQSLLQEAQSRFRIEKQDHKVILKSGLFNIQYAYPWQGRSRLEAVKKFTKSWSRGRNLRKPMPGFHPGIYAEQSLVEEKNSLAHYIRNGLPRGPWSVPVIEPPIIGGKGRASLNAALHIHLYYYDQAQDIARRILKSRSPVDLFISVSSATIRDEALKLFGKMKGRRVDVRIVPNRGRDMGPLLTEFADDLKHYEAVGHFHTKLSPHYHNRTLVKNWVNLLSENTLGGKKPMIDVILNAMASNPRLGMIFPDDPQVVGWTCNRDQAIELVKRIGYSEADLPQKHINFPVGMMFWARINALKPLFDLKLDWSNYPEEPLSLDGTMLHALERILPIVAMKEGFETATTYVRGCLR